MQELEEQARDTGVVPQSLANRPLLIRHGLDFYLDAFLELNATRAFTMGAYLPLSYTDKQSLCNEYGCEGEVRRRMFRHLTDLDHAWLAYQRKIAKEDKPDKNSVR